MVPLMACAVEVARLRHGPASGVWAAAVITAVVVAGLNVAALQGAVWAGLVGRQMTWSAYLRLAELAEGGPVVQDAQFLARSMRRVEERVESFVRETDLEHVSLAVTGGRIGSWHEAGSMRSGRNGHVALGYFWLCPEHSAALPYIVEHELAHLRRNDSRVHLLLTSIRAGCIVLCLGLLPILPALLVVGLLAVSILGHAWWTELACDRAAAVRCGRDVAVGAWKLDLNQMRQLPLLRRAFSSAVAMCTHPPAAVRLWWARKSPDLPISAS
ncbi:hypothetical protein K7472_30405 [Streptomyces sp. PTM05]|uniref:Peptidase M48 domain-containing protein n=1 Tax=Streptantibioticus parmotrematis TaxID=2873249 RepID=A0ABS7R4Y7_9ACTN|nr:hypothetical protein [Streptantibioticus parmotrematis]MBY8889124.1 hypothetical protein [Streptantibioticus parmotrematis]